MKKTLQILIFLSTAPLFGQDIYINELARSIVANDVDEMEQLGIYECDEEDVALCSFVCPSKTDVGGIIRKGLDLIYFDG
jgi:Na+-transporting NADH:ubiquinone oxidoreductase subunit A